MNAEQFAEKLTELKACSDATAWAAGKTLSQAWKECPRPGWMLWLLGRSTINKKVIATIAVEFAEMTVGNASAYPAVAECIAVTKRYLIGEATAEELSAARSAAISAWSAAISAWSAAESAAESAEESAAISAWSAAVSAESAAESAARSAISAAISAAESAARSARSAAISAAESAARSARSAAISAAESAARSARSAAWSAAWSAQCEIIRKHVGGEEIASLLK